MTTFKVTTIACAVLMILCLRGNSALAASNCAKVLQEKKAQGKSLSKDQKYLAEAQKIREIMNTNDPATIHKWYRYSTLRVNHFRMELSGTDGATRAAHEPQLKLLEQQLDYWRAKETEVQSGGIISGGGVEAWDSYVNSEIARAQRDISFQKGEIAMLKSDVKVCERLARSGTSHVSAPRGMHLGWKLCDWRREDYRFRRCGRPLMERRASLGGQL